MWEIDDSSSSTALPEMFLSISWFLEASLLWVNTDTALSRLCLLAENCQKANRRASQRRLFMAVKHSQCVNKDTKTILDNIFTICKKTFLSDRTACYNCCLCTKYKCYCCYCCWSWYDSWLYSFFKNTYFPKS